MNNTIIKTTYVVSGNPELEDQELPVLLYNALGMTFYKFVEITLDKVGNAIKGKRGKQLHVRCFKTKERGQGWCFKTAGWGPDIVLGFCGDIEDLEITLIHELLHLFRWDEKILEAKARKIYNRGSHGNSC